MRIVGIIMVIVAVTLAILAVTERYQFTSPTSIIGSDPSSRCAVCGAPATWKVVPKSDESRILDFRCDEHKGSGDPGAGKFFLAIILGLLGAGLIVDKSTKK